MMRTNIEIDDDLMADALRLTGLRTKREAVDQALRLMVRLERQRSVRELYGKLDWEGDLDEMRRSR